MSVVNLEHNHIFIHNPKTAGSSMEAEEWVGGSSHQTIYEFRRENEQLFSWGFVRDPIQRFLSAYANYLYKGHFSRMLGREYGIKDWIKFLKENMFEPQNMSCSLASFHAVFPNVRKKSGHEFPLIQFVPQYLFLCVNREIAVDFVGRYENLAEDWKFVADKFYRGSALIHKNASGAKKPVLDKKDIKTLRKIYKHDYRIFGYE